MEPTANDPRDLTIHLRDAALYLLLRWRLWASAALAGAILLTAVRYVEDLRRYRAEQAAPAPITTLSADGRARVAAAMGYEAAYRRVCAHNEAAPLMRIDPGAAPTRRMRLLITGEGCWTAACLYQEYVEAEHLYREVAETEAQAPYLAELVTVAVEVEPAETAPQRAFLTVVVIAPTEETCNRLSSVVHRAVEEGYAAVAQAVGDHLCTWAFDRYAVLQDETVATRQQTALEQQTHLQEAYAAAKRELTAAEEEYLLRLMGQTVGGTASSPTISRVAWLWGFLLGGGVGFVWLMVGYLFCGRVLSAADAVSRHGVAVVGVLGDRRRPFARLRDAAEEPLLLWQRLAVAAQAKGVTRLYLSVSAEEERRLTGLSQVLTAHGVSLSVGRSPAADAASAQTLSACDGAAVACLWGVTTHRAVARELALAKQWDIPVVGLLLLQ